MSIVVFYLRPDPIVEGWLPRHEAFESSEFGEAMRRIQELRDKGYQHVVMSSQFDGAVGKPGVDAVENGKTPDGHDYEWTKKHRGAGPESS
jgi:hypothetical protein